MGVDGAVAPESLEERLRYFLDHPERRRVVASQLQQMAAA